MEVDYVSFVLTDITWIKNMNVCHETNTPILDYAYLMFLIDVH
jgi:hypothetical protein